MNKMSIVVSLYNVSTVFDVALAWVYNLCEVWDVPELSKSWKRLTNALKILFD